MPKTTPREETTLKKMEQNPNAPRYVSCDLNKAQKDALLVFIEETEDRDIIAWIDMRVGDNHILSTKGLDVGYQASLTGTSQARDHANCCLISRASTPSKALWSVFFKDQEVLKGLWPVTNRLEDLDA
jgi:hypothetical protein